MSKKTKSTKYDYAIIGGGLAGLLSARILTLAGAQVVVFEGQDQLGGSGRSFSTAWGSFFSGLKSLPNCEGLFEALEFISRRADTGFSFSWEEIQLKTWDNGQMKDFVGFGDLAPAYSELIQSFLTPKSLRTEPLISELCELSSAAIGCDVMTKSVVSAFNFQENKIVSCLVNGQHEIFADQFIFAAGWTSLKELVPVEVWGAKGWSRAAKVKSWTAVFSDIVVKTSMPLSLEPILLKGTPQDQMFPCLGRWLALGDDRYIGQWTSFIQDGDAEDTEEVGHVLKRVKRQIKQAFPEALNQIEFERISINPSWGLTARPSQYLPEVENLHWVSGFVNEIPGLPGLFLQLESILKPLVHKLDQKTSFQDEQTQDPDVLECQSASHVSGTAIAEPFVDSPV